MIGLTLIFPSCYTFSFFLHAPKMTALCVSYPSVFEVKNEDLHLCSKEDKQWIKRVDMPYQKKKWNEAFSQVELNFETNSAKKTKQKALLF